MADKELSKGELIGRLQRMRSSMRNVRDEAAKVTNRVVDTSLTLGGGVASGVLRGWNDDGTPVEVPGTEIPADAALAAGLIVLGVSGMGGDASDHIVNLGAGMGAAAAAFQVKDMVRKARTE